MAGGQFQFSGGLAKSLIFIGLILTGGGLSYAISFALINSFYGLDLFSNPLLLNNLNDPSVVASLKVIQLANVLGAFILPSLFFAYLVSDRWLDYLRLRKIPRLWQILTIFLIVIISQPWINLTVALNESIAFPEFLTGIESWMMQKEQEAELITESFMAMNTLYDLFYNLFLIGLIAALGEELFFRGLIQPFLLRRTGNHHTAIWITAIIFSAIHLQFYGFFPRMFLGALFGYLMVWTGSLWAPILAHFANNAGAVAISYLFSDSQLSNKIEELGSSSDDWAYLVITAPIMYFLVKSIFNKREVIP